MAKRKAFRIRDIARESGASLTTVSLVLNQRDERISESTRQRVLAAAQRLGYQPSRLAQGLQSQKTGILAVLVPELQHVFADVYFGELLSAIHDHASAVNYKVLLEVAHPDFVSQAKHIELFDRDYVDGVLCIGVTNKDDYLVDFEDRSRPAIIVNNHLPARKLNFVRCDYEEAGRLAAQYLLGLGHRRFGLIHGAPEVQTSLDWRAGVLMALAAAGIGPTPDHLADGLYTEEGGFDAAIELLRRDPAITAILTGNDKMAIGALRGIKKSGRGVPHDVSVVGCDGIHLSAFTDPALTTVHTPLYDIGREACRLLLDLVDNRIDRAEVVRPVSLTVRESAAPAT